MKKLSLTSGILAVLALWANITFAQIKTPPASPTAKFSTSVGLTDVSLEYSRPSKKGRTIFGTKDALVPYGEMWRTGANKNSIITFSDDVKVGGKELKKGAYAIFTTPNADMWKVYFYSDTENWGTPEKWDDAKVAAALDIKPITLPADFAVETFFIHIGDVGINSALIEIVWDHTAVPIALEVEVDKKVVASIESTLAGPKQGDYHNAARYYRETNKDLVQALAWSEKATEKDAKFWMLREKALILAAIGRYDDAIATAKKSTEIATTEGNKDYPRMNDKSIGEWTAAKGKTDMQKKMEKPATKKEQKAADQK